MYNGIGLPTARGSGTSGYVQKNLSQLKPSTLIRKPTSVSHDGDSPYSSTMSSSRPALRRTSEDIIKHNQKRQVEVRVMEYVSELEEAKRYAEEEIEAKADGYRGRLLELYEKKEKEAQYAEEHEDDLKEKANARFRDAFGISGDAKEGDAFRFEEIASRKLVERSDREYGSGK